MTALQMVNKALGLLGYSENNNNLDLTQRVMSRALPLVNIVYSDIRRISGLIPKDIETLSEDLEIPSKAYDVMACGLASYISGSENDDSAQAFWSAEYQARRTTLSQVTGYTDVLPTADY